MTDSPAVASLRRKLESHLEELFGGCEADPDGDFMLAHGSTMTWLRPMDWEDGRTIVRVWAVTNVDVRVGPELARFLLNENANQVFGGFALDPAKRTVAFGHTLLGDFLQRKELALAIAGVVNAADEYDDRIKARFGGKLFTET
jgi:hypothetical protein